MWKNGQVGKLSDLPCHPEPSYQHASSTHPSFTRSVPLSPYFLPTDKETENSRGYPWTWLSSLQELSLFCVAYPKPEGPPLGFCPLPLHSSHPDSALGIIFPQTQGVQEGWNYPLWHHIASCQGSPADPPPKQGRAEPCCTEGLATPPAPHWPSMEALVYAFSELRIREGAGLWGGVAGGEMSSLLTWAQSQWSQRHTWLREEWPLV